MLGHKSSIRASSPGQAGLADCRGMPRLSGAAQQSSWGQDSGGTARLLCQERAQGTGAALGTDTAPAPLLLQLCPCFFSACLATSLFALAFPDEMLDVPNSAVKLFSLKVEMYIKCWF